MSLALNACGAGWDANVWPSEDNFRGYQATNTLYVFVSDIAATNSAGVVATNEWIVHAQVSSNAWGGTYDREHTTQAVLQVKDLWSWDAVASLSERATVSGAGAVLPYQGAFWRYERDNLVQYKTWLKSSIPAFLDPADVGNSWTVTGLLDYVNAPTNWCEYTPYRSLNGAGPNYERVEQNCWTISTNVAGVVTQSVCDMWGQANSITGTNGETVCRYVTNENILASFATTDYGWRFFDEIVNELYLVPETVAFGWNSGIYTTDNNYSWAGVSAATWANAKTGAEADAPFTNAYANRIWSYTWGRKNAADDWDAFAEAHKNVIEVTGMATNYDHQAYAMVLPILPSVSVDSKTYDDQGSGWGSNAWNAVFTSAVFNAASVTSSVLGSVSFPPVWVDAPTSTAARGYLIDSSDLKAYSDWAVTNGFTYQ